MTGPRPPVVVVGGGIAGLTAAHVLKERGIPFLLLEASERLGGVIRTENVQGFLLEGGPDSLLAQKPEGLALLMALGLEERLQPTNPEARTVYVLHRGRLHSLPEGTTLTVPTRVWPVLRSGLFSWPGKLRMSLDLVRPARRDGSDESIAAFVRRRFGGEVLERLAEPLLAGIHAGDPERLSLRATFPRLFALEERHGSVVRGLRASPPPPSNLPTAFVALRGGLGELVDALAARLPPEALRTRSPVGSIERLGAGFMLRLGKGADERIGASAIILALPPRAAATLVAPLSPVAGSELASIRFASTVVLVLGFRREDVDHPLDGYGLIVPRREGLRTTALSFHSTKFEGRTPEGQVMLRVFLGGISDGAVVDIADTELVALARREMGSVLGLRGEPTLVRVFRWREATPQMEIGHLQKVARVERALEGVPGLFLCGSGFRSTGLPDTIGDAQRAARGADAFLSAGRVKASDRVSGER